MSGGRGHPADPRAAAERTATPSQLAQVVDGLPQPVFWKDHAGVYLGCNKTFARAAGLDDPRQISGKTDRDLPWHDQAEAFRAEDRAIMESRRPLWREVRMLRGRDGTTTWWATTKVPLENGTGGVIGVLGFSEDVTERKLAEEALLDRDKRLATLGQNIPGVIYQFQVKPDGTYCFPYVNERWLDLFGISPREAMASADSSMALIVPEDRAMVDAAIRRSARTLEPWIIEFRVKTGGHVKWLLGHSIPDTPGSDGSIIWNGVLLDISDRKAAELALQEEDRRLVALGNSIPGAIFLSRMTRDGQLSLPYVNERWFDFFGVTPAEAMASADSSFARIEPGDLARVRDSILRSAQTIEPWSCEYRIRIGDRIRWVHGQGRPEPVAADGSIVWNGVLIDVTEQKRAESALAEDEMKLRLIFENSPAGVALVSLDGQYLAVNPAFTEIFGYSADDLLRGTFFDITHPEDRERSGRIMRQVIDGGGRTIRFAKRYLHKDGHTIWADVRSELVHGPDGKPKHFVTHVVDITERKNAEAKVAEQAALLETANDAIMVRDLDHRILYWNKGCERLYGWKAADAVGRRSTDLVDRDERAFEAAFAQFMRDGAWAGELRNASQDGREIIVLSRWTLVRDEAGQPKSVLVINADISEKRQLQDQLLRAQRLESIGQLASGVAHDLNNILAPMIMVAPLLRAEIKRPEILRLVDILESNTRRGADVVKQILTFARGLKGGKGPVPTRPLLKEVATVLGETIPKSITVDAIIPEDLWTVEGDATQLMQVLMNLCVNARDAMPDGGTLTLSGENLLLDEGFVRTTPEARPGPYVVWLVADTGVGISAENLNRIFSPFFTTKEVGKGTGLGLATAMGIVRSHAGFIKVESREGAGSRFHVYLPALPDQAAIEPEPPGPVARGRGEAILVVDDEEGVRVTTRQILEAHGYRVLIAAEGSKAVALFEQHQAEIQAVVTDLMMPVMDGVALVRALRERAPGIKVVATTGVMEAAKTTAVRALGVHAVIRKPFSTHQLLAELRAALDGTTSPASAGGSNPPG